MEREVSKSWRPICTTCRPWTRREEITLGCIFATCFQCGNAIRVPGNTDPDPREWHWWHVEDKP